MLNLTRRKGRDIERYYRQKIPNRRRPYQLLRVLQIPIRR